MKLVINKQLEFTTKLHWEHMQCMRLQQCFKETSIATAIGMHISCLVSGASWPSFEKQRRMFIETAVFSLRVKVVLSAPAMLVAGCCTFYFWSLLHNGLSFVNSTRLFPLENCRTILCWCQSNQSVTTVLTVMRTLNVMRTLKQQKPYFCTKKTTKLSWLSSDEALDI